LASDWPFARTNCKQLHKRYQTPKIIMIAVCLWWEPTAFCVAVTCFAGEIRASFDWKQKKTGTNVHPVLTSLTKAACRDWIKISRKLPEHFLFTRTKANSAPPITASSYRRMVKQWAELIDLDGEQYSTHSLRRSKPSWMYAQGVSVEDLAQLLGHRSIESTLRYLGLSLAKAQAEALKHDIFKTKPKNFDETT